mmetsp:Transcript_30505/g.97509  ORF Transcript_30505/g.97509 Transcript_30505/m.97509 type:complete len:250 (+) Transcript_30505:181-930(+)
MITEASSPTAMKKGTVELALQGSLWSRQHAEHCTLVRQRTMKRWPQSATTAFSSRALAKTLYNRWAVCLFWVRCSQRVLVLMPTKLGSNHTAMEPSACRAATALKVEHRQVRRAILPVTQSPSCKPASSSVAPSSRTFPRNERLSICPPRARLPSARSLRLRTLSLRLKSFLCRITWLLVRCTDTRSSDSKEPPGEPASRCWCHDKQPPIYTLQRPPSQGRPPASENWRRDGGWCGRRWAGPWGAAQGP